jgi:cytochrome c peroxidase
MRVTRCDGCKKDILPPKHVFLLETKDQGSTHQYSGMSVLKMELCVSCHNEVRKAVNAFTVPDVEVEPDE